MKNLNITDYFEAANLLNVDVATIKAVASVEANGSGFLKDGRPKILFEAHIFSRLTKKQFDISHPNISSSVWNKKLYKGNEGEYGRLEIAKRLNQTAALQSASWGKFQIMGFNYKLAGFNNVKAFVEAMNKTEREHLLAFANFIKSNKTMWDALKSKTWEVFARHYNGPGYKKNNYHTKIETAYNNFSSKT